ASHDCSPTRPSLFVRLGLAVRHVSLELLNVVGGEGGQLTAANQRNHMPTEVACIGRPAGRLLCGLGGGALMQVALNQLGNSHICPLDMAISRRVFSLGS